MWGLAPPPHPRESAGRFTPCFLKWERLRRIFHESHSLARCSKWAHLHFSSACASMQTRCASPLPFLMHPLLTCRSGEQRRARKGLKGQKGCASLQSCGAVALFSQRSLFQNWGKAPCAFAGCRGGASTCEAQRRHRGARSAMASAMSVLCKICGARGKLRSTLLAVLRRKALAYLLLLIFFSPIWGFSLNLSFFVYLAYAGDPPFEGLKGQNHQNENFSFHRFLPCFYRVFGRFACLHQFQITSY